MMYVQLVWSCFFGGRGVVTVITEAQMNEENSKEKYKLFVHLYLFGERMTKLLLERIKDNRQ